MKLHRKDIVDTYREELDSVKFQHSKLDDDLTDKEMVVRCESLWTNLEPMRRSRARCLRFAYGDHWDDKILINGKWMRQREYLSRMGGVALQTNQVKKVISSIAGLWSKEKNEPVAHALKEELPGYGEGMTEVLKTNWKNNSMTVLGSEWLNEANLGGLAVAREEWSKRGGTDDAYTTAVSPNMFFFESGMQDSRFWDLSLVGQLHDLAFNDLCAKFAEKPSDFSILREWYASDSRLNAPADSYNTADLNREEDLSFNRPMQRGYCRVIEVWTRERRPRYHVLDTNSPEEPYDINADDKEMIRQIEDTNKSRLEEGKRLGWDEKSIPLIEYKNYWYMDTYWYCRYLTPDGHVLWEGESDRPDRSHPYTILAVPFTNGIIRGNSADAIDQNIAINRALVVDDWVRRAGAKGVMMVPEDIVPDWMSWDEFAEQATSINGVVYYKPKPHQQMPKMFYGNTAQLDTANMVKLMSDLMESSVSVSGAIQGKTPYAGTSAAMYAQQTQNSATPLAPLLDRFEAFMNDVAMKKLTYIQQNYTIEQYSTIVSSSDSLRSLGLDLARLGDLKYKVRIEQGLSTPTYRMMANDNLKEFLMGGLIPFEDYLAVCTEPYAFELRKRLEARKAELAQMQAAGVAPAQQEEQPAS